MGGLIDTYQKVKDFDLSTWIIDELKQVGVAFAKGVLFSADYALVVALVLLIMFIMGSKKAGTWLYWSIGIYALLQFFQGVIK